MTQDTFSLEVWFNIFGKLKHAVIYLDKSVLELGSSVKTGDNYKIKCKFSDNKCIEDFEVRSHSPHTSLHYNTDLILSR